MKINFFHPWKCTTSKVKYRSKFWHLWRKPPDIFSKLVGDVMTHIIRENAGKRIKEIYFLRNLFLIFLFQLKIFFSSFELFQSCFSIVGRAAKHEDLRAAHSYLLCEFSSVHKKKNMFVVSLWSSFGIDIRFRLKRNLRAIAEVQIWLDYILIYFSGFAKVNLFLKQW